MNIYFFNRPRVAPSNSFEGVLYSIIILLTVAAALTPQTGCQNRPADPNLLASFDRVQFALDAIPGVTIEHSWLHHENSLREFGFDVRYYRSEPIRLIFPESNNLNQFTQTKLGLELEQLIKAQATWIIN